MRRVSKIFSGISKPLRPLALNIGVRSLATDKKISIAFEKPFETFLCEGPANKEDVSGAELLEYYRQMQALRRMEIAADQLYKKKAIRGFCHLYNGQEAIAVGMESAITHEDAIITAYRCHATSRGRGLSYESIFGELLGKETGCSKGKGGSMHMYNKKTHYYGGNGIVGAQVPIGAGIAFAQKYLKNGKVTFSMYGDGAANQGQVFEAYNMAALWELPCVFVCENNHFGMGTADKRASADVNFFKRAGYIPGLRVDAMSVVAVKKAVLYAAEHARTKGPFVLEMETYRYVGHSMSDPGTTYRTRDDVDKIRKSRDPINKVKVLILDNGIATEDELKEFDKTIKQEIDDAVAKAEAASDPDMSQLWTNVLQEDVPIRGVELVNSYKYPFF